ncbi:MAG: PTS transporter subunit EIIC, partial [Bacteroidota bacterium]
QASEVGKSIFFMLESNPGPGLGILVAYALFSKGMAKQSAPGAIIIHFLGGIHEIYFPYILMNPILLIAVILGGMSGVFTFGLLGAGLIAPPAPGSIFAYIVMSPRGGMLPVMTGVLVSAIVSFLVASVFIKRSKEFSGQELSDAQAAIKDMKLASKGLNGKTTVKKIVVACDAGMGSSAMSASVLRNKLNKAGLKIEVTNCAIEDIPSDADIVITHESLSDRARSVAPLVEHISIKNFVNCPEYDELVKRLA